MREQRPEAATKSDCWSHVRLVTACVLELFTWGMYRNQLAGLVAPDFLIRFLRGRKVGVG